MRDNFTKKSIRIAAKRVSYLCSNPECKCNTIGSQAGGEGSISIGVAAHITAASVGGPRYDSSQSSDARRDGSNCIWLCQSCSKLIDSDDKYFTVELLQKWKRMAEEQAFLSIASAPSCLAPVSKRTIEFDETDRAIIQQLGLPTKDDIETVTARLLEAAQIDIQTFKDIRGWPRHSIYLNLRMQLNEHAQAMSVENVAKAIAVSSEASLIAEPGTGKTTTLLQVADTILSSNDTIPIFLPLGEWSSQSDNIFQLLTHRNAFQGFLKQHFMLLAYHGRLVLLLDGWNELDPISRVRAIREINALRRDYPLLSIMISTRRQSHDVPISGPAIEIDGLSEDQQLEIARTTCGKDGEVLLEHAWRTPGLNELISIPLYLNALLANAETGAMPTTKEEVLRLFVEEHENFPETADVLERDLLGFHRDFLVTLAVEATQATNTTIQDRRARMVISQTEDQLVADGQITDRPQPKIVLDVLVSQHTLIRSTANSGVSFQHQQFQEWFASFEVERLMLGAAEGDGNAKKLLADNVLNMPAWEESILFTCDRLSRNGKIGSTAVSSAILRSLSIDPILASEMIYRSSSAAWNLVKEEVTAFVGKWHKAGTVDRAVRFMITTGCPEFAPLILPLVTNPDNQVHLSAFRTARRFRASVLGPDFQEKIAAISEKIRVNVVAEIAYEGGIDGIELATSLAKADPSVEVQYAAISSLAWRRAERFVTDILETAPASIWPLLASRGYCEMFVPKVVERIRSELQSFVEGEPNILTKIRMLMEWGGNSSEFASQIATLIESEQFPIKEDFTSVLLRDVFERFPQEVSVAMLCRIGAGRDLPGHSAILLENVPVIDEGPIPAIIVDCSRENSIADMAAVVAGPKTVGVLIGKFLALEEMAQKMELPIGQVTREECRRLRNRLSLSRPEVLLSSIQSHGKTKDPNLISFLAKLISRHGKNDDVDLLQTDSGLMEPVVLMIQDWVKTLLTSPEANRHHFVEVVGAIKRLPKSEFVDSLRCLLAEDLSQWQRARQDFFKREIKGPATPKVTYSYTNQYRSAFSAIGDDQVFRLMEKYLPDPIFGFDAALVLKEMSNRAQGIARDDELCESSPHANAIFSAIEQIVDSESGERDQRHALQLAKVGLSMPYGDRENVIKGLLSIPLPTLEKRGLLESLTYAGETISADMVLDGLRELIEEAKQKTWLLEEPQDERKYWLSLMPFSDRPEAIKDAFALVDMSIREPWNLRWLLSALGRAPSPQTEQLLVELAENDSRFYSEHAWLDAIVSHDTPSSARLLLNLICDGKLTGNDQGYAGRRLTQDLGNMIRNHSDMQIELIRRYEEDDVPRINKVIIERAIAKLADPDALLVLVRGYIRNKCQFDGTLHRLIETVALGKQPSGNWGDSSYYRYSISIAALRKGLFEMINSDPDSASVVEVCLNVIDELRDEYGHVDSEPRHPDISSNRPWPLV